MDLGYEERIWFSKELLFRDRPMTRKCGKYSFKAHLLTISSSKPALLFIPSAWHDPSCFNPTTTLLEQAGYNCDRIPLPSVGSELRNELPPQGWDADVAEIRRHVLERLDSGSDVVLVAHSYAGTVGSEAVKGLSRKDRGKGKTAVVRLVYLSAIVLDMGHWIWGATRNKPIDPTRTVMKVYAEHFEHTYVAYITEFDVAQGDLCYANDTVSWFYNQCSSTQHTQLPKKLQSHAWKSFLSTVTYTAWKDVPSTFLVCENDNAVNLESREAMLRTKGNLFEIERCDADHSPPASRPERTAMVIRKAAGERI